MARAGSYPQVDFKESQRFLARDPSRSQVVRVPGDSIIDAAVAALILEGGVVQAIDTLTEAVATDYASGVYVLTGGATTVIDGGQAIYRVSDPGSGGIVMDNGNELVLLFQANSGTAAALDATTGPLDLTANRLWRNDDLVKTTTANDLTAGSMSRVDDKWHTAQLGAFMTYGGAANAITLTAVNTTTVTSFSEGQKVRFRATATNTGATTINGDPCIDPQGNALTAGYIGTNADTTAVFDGTSWVVSEIEGQIGVNQTWQDVKGSRATATTYTNTTGKPIGIQVTASSTAAADNLTYSVDGAVIGRTYMGSAFNSFNVSFIVPVGSTYQVDVISIDAIFAWNELR